MNTLKPKAKCPNPSIIANSTIQLDNTVKLVNNFMTIDNAPTQIKDNKAFKIPPKSKVVSIKLKDSNSYSQN